jgi:hypothetical protein
MKKIFILFSLLSFIVVTGANAQTTTKDNNPTKENKKVTVTRDNALKVLDKTEQTKTTTAPEKNEEFNGTSNNNSTNNTYNRSDVNNKQTEKREVTITKKTDIVTPKK